jgi:hypothetical protein
LQFLSETKFLCLLRRVPSPLIWDVQANSITKGYAPLPLDPSGDAAPVFRGGFERTAKTGVCGVNNWGGQMAGAVFHIHGHGCAAGKLQARGRRDVGEIREARENKRAAKVGGIKASEAHFTGDSIKLFLADDGQLAGVSNLGVARVLGDDPAARGTCEAAMILALRACIGEGKLVVGGRGKGSGAIWNSAKPNDGTGVGCFDKGGHS